MHEVFEAPPSGEPGLLKQGVSEASVHKSLPLESLEKKANHGKMRKMELLAKIFGDD